MDADQGSMARLSTILDHCCQAWNKLADQPWLSIGMRQWAYGF
jgi:hypothetical protein